MPSDIASTSKLAHLVSLRNLGGVERYFSRFYTSYGRHLDLDILLQTQDIHPFIRSSLIDAKHRIHSIKGPGSWKLPEIMGLREAYQRTLVRRLDPDAIVVWNKMAGNPIPLLTGRPVFHYVSGPG